jgi:hypothetical protein
MSQLALESSKFAEFRGSQYFELEPLSHIKARSPEQAIS